MPRKCSPATGCPLDKKAQEETEELYKHQVELKDISKEDIILDVRSHGEHFETSLKQPHYLVELNSLDVKKFLTDYHVGNKKIYILCGSGYRATQAAKKFEEAGYDNIAIIKDGISALGEEHLNKSAVISLERQTRIGVGSLIVLSVLLGCSVSPLFYLATFFFGAGLIYAGISNFCGLALLLSKMPWNK